MTRATAIRANAFALTLSLLAALSLAAVALAAKPAPGAHFKGRTSAAPILGFYAPVTFTVSQSGQSLGGFSFGSFGCFGAGGFRPGVNPYTSGSIIHLGTVKVSASGRISVSGAKSSHTVAGQTTVTTVAVNARFTTPKAASGSITFTQKVTGTVNSSCGPGKIAFTATGH
jgi:hypothetical protein